MCTHCQKVFYKSTVPHAGFIPVTTVRKIARAILKDHGASKSDIQIALRIARGTRHRVGPWDQRPPYRLTPLLTGGPDKRRPQLLVGKRNQPSMDTCAMALVHEVLLKEVLETGKRYARAVAGMTFFGSRGLYVAPGEKPDQGPARHSIYRLNHYDFAIVGTVAIRTCRAVNLEVKDRNLRAQIVTMYLGGQEAGDYQDPLYPPKLAMRTNKIGDHPLDFRMPRKSWIPPHLQGKIVRAGGTCNGKPATLKPVLPKPEYRSAIHKVEPKVAPKVFDQQPRREAPPTDWIWNISSSNNR